MTIVQGEVLIRLLEDEQAFVYTILRGGETVESAVVRPAAPECVSSAEYYGGSEAMD